MTKLMKVVPQSRVMFGVWIGRGHIFIQVDGPDQISHLIKFSVDLAINPLSLSRPIFKTDFCSKKGGAQDSIKVIYRFSCSSSRYINHMANGIGGKGRPKSHTTVYQEIVP